MLRVLIVDDEPGVLDGLEKIVPWEEFGLELADRAVSGEQALAFIHQTPIDILITDVRMEGMNGIELITEIRKTHPAVRSIIISAFDEFDYVKMAIQLGVENYLLKPISRDELFFTLEKIIEKQAHPLRPSELLDDSISIFRENLLNRWIAGTIRQSEFVERAELAQVDIFCSEYLVLIISAVGRPSEADPEFFSVQRSVVDEVFKGRFQWYRFFDSAGRMVLIFCGEGLSEWLAPIHATVKRCLERLAHQIGTPTFATLGEVVQGSGEVKRSYSTALFLQRYSMLEPANTVIGADQLPGEPSHGKQLTPMEYHRLEELIQEKKSEEAQAFVADTLDRMQKDRGLTLGEKKALVLELVFHLFIPLRLTGGVGDAELPFNTLLVSYGDITTADELQSWLICTVNTIIEYIRKCEAKKNPVIRQITEYLILNYRDDISLKTLAAQYRINASYLGQLFKTETGELFTNYLNRIRIEAAARMLITTEHNIADICRLSGYRSISYFDHHFKKTYGITPQEYRRSYSV